MAYRGEYQHTIDDKGRLSFPVKFREQLGRSFVATKGILDECLYIYSTTEWQALEDKFRQSPSARKEVRRFIRLFFGSAHDLECDKLGRVLLPANLREYAGLCKDVTVVGALNRIELWDGAKHRQETSQVADENHIERIEEAVSKLGINI